MDLYKFKDSLGIFCVFMRYFTVNNFQSCRGQCPVLAKDKMKHYSASNESHRSR